MSHFPEFQRKTLLADIMLKQTDLIAFFKQKFPEQIIGVVQQKRAGPLVVNPVKSQANLN